MSAPVCPYCKGRGMVLVSREIKEACDARCEGESAAPSETDDPILDATDGAHPAWWRGHDRAAEMLTAHGTAMRDEIERLTDEAKRAFDETLNARAELTRAREQHALDLAAIMEYLAPGAPMPDADAVIAAAERMAADIAAARAALAWVDGPDGLLCDECARLATRAHRDGGVACDDGAQCGGACDPACDGPCVAWSDLPHAAAIRAARGAR